MSLLIDGQFSAFVELGSHSFGAYALSVSTTSASITLVPGSYKVWLKSGDASVGVFAKVGGAATVPGDATVDSAVFGWRGSDTERVRLAPGESALHVILSSGAAADTLYLIRIK